MSTSMTSNSEPSGASGASGTDDNDSEEDEEDSSFFMTEPTNGHGKLFIRLDPSSVQDSLAGVPLSSSLHDKEFTSREEGNHKVSPAKPSHKRDNHYRTQAAAEDASDDSPTTPVKPKKAKKPKKRVKVSAGASTHTSLRDDSETHTVRENSEVKKSKKSKKRTKKAISASLASMSPSDEEADTKPEKRRPGRPKAPPPPPPCMAVTVWIEVNLPPTITLPVKGRATKSVKNPPAILGPQTLTDGISWEDFIKIIAKWCQVDTDAVMSVISSMRWCFQTKAGKHAGALPLGSDVAYVAMLKQIKSLPGAQCETAIIFILMDPPVPVKKPTLSWLQDPVDVEPAVESATMIQGHLDSLMGKKETVDKSIDPIKEILKAKYAVGTCAHHPAIRCFVYAPKQWHFELDSNRLAVWAHAILRSNTDDVLPPLGNKFFKPDYAMPVTTTTSIVNPTTPGPPVSHLYSVYPTQQGPPAYAQPQYPQMPMNPYSPFGTPWPGFDPRYNMQGFTPGMSLHGGTAVQGSASPFASMSQPGPNPTEHHSSKHLPSLNRSSSPAIPEVEDLLTWCTSLGLVPAQYFATALDVLQFRVGDDVGELSRSEVKELTGLESLQWVRFTKAYDKYLHRIRKGKDRA